MAEIKEISQITTLPGVKRDGTNLDGDNFVDAQWTRFMRGRPKKMGGYAEVASPVPGVTRAALLWSRGDFNGLVTCSEFGITQASLDNNGGSGTTYDRTPMGWSAADGAWTLDTMYDDAVASKKTIILAHRNNAGAKIDDPDASQVYYGIADDTTAFLPIAGLSVSGGVCCIAPYLVYYGSDGLVGWSDVNQPQTLTTGDAGQDRVTGAKVVKGLPFRSGSGPACVLWSLDSVIRMDYVGGAAIFRFSTVTNQSSILSQNSVIEYDGDYFWVGIDRFLAYTGGKVVEIPNQMNKNWFFDNVNYNQRQKIWVTKVPRFGEIIWFFPSGESEECDTAVVFNINEKTWYDFKLSRSAGYYSQVFNHPIWVGDSPQQLVRLGLSTTTGSFQEGDTISGNTSTDTAIVNKVESGTSLLLTPITFTSVRPALFQVGETVTNLNRAGSGTITQAMPLNSPYVHEKGKDAVFNNYESAIPAWFETSDFGYPTGGATQNNIKGLNRYTRLIRIEPDFRMAGNMTVEVIGREFAQSPDTVSAPFTFGADTGKIDLREQRRQIRLRFQSNELNGDFEMGRTILHTEPGDVRS